MNRYGDSLVNGPDNNQKEPEEVVRTVDSQDLLKGQKTLVIRHGDQSYRLVLTRNNRLILQK